MSQPRYGWINEFHIKLTKHTNRHRKRRLKRKYLLQAGKKYWTRDWLKQVREWKKRKRMIRVLMINWQLYDSWENYLVEFMRLRHLMEYLPTNTIGRTSQRHWYITNLASFQRKNTLIEKEAKTIPLSNKWTTSLCLESFKEFHEIKFRNLTLVLFLLSKSVQIFLRILHRIKVKTSIKKTALKNKFSYFTRLAYTLNLFPSSLKSLF